MNYYERHLGDYARDTAHLSLLEHGVYTLLLDRYYATEGGIPADQVHRLARARSEDERAAVDAVLAEFFTLTDGVWINARAEVEIDRMQQRMESARRNGRNGGRPRKTEAQPEPNPPETRRDTQQKPSGFSLGSENETGSKALHTPDTSNQKIKNNSTREQVALPDWLPRAAWVDWTDHRKRIKAPMSPKAGELCIRDLGKHRTNGHDPVTVIEHSIKNGWRGLFAPHDTQRPGATHEAPRKLSAVEQVRAAIAGRQQSESVAYLDAESRRVG